MRSESREADACAIYSREADVFVVSQSQEAGECSVNRGRLTDMQSSQEANACAVNKKRETCMRRESRQVDI